MVEVRAGPGGLGSRIVQLGLIISGTSGSSYVDSPQSFLRVFRWHTWLA